MQALNIPPSTAAFRSFTSPQDFDVDWIGFYPTAWERGQALRRHYRHEAGVRYGPAPAMVMNVFYPAKPLASGLVFVYMHGGAFSEGHPDFADFAGERLLAQGITFVSMGYRLAPTRFPDSAVDVAQGLAFLERHLAKQAGGNLKYCLGGHSAGAAIAALLGTRPELAVLQGLAAGAIDSMVLVSGLYDFGPSDPSSGFVEPERREDASAVRHARNAPRKTLLVYGDPEPNRKGNPPDVFKVRSFMLEGALLSHGHHVERVAMQGADHVATAQAFDHDQVFARVLASIHEN